MAFFNGLRQRQVAAWVAATFVVGLLLSAVVSPLDAQAVPGSSGAVAVHVHGDAAESGAADTGPAVHIHVNKCCSTPCQETAAQPRLEARSDLVPTDRWVATETRPSARSFVPPHRPPKAAV